MVEEKEKEDVVLNEAENKIIPLSSVPLLSFLPPLFFHMSFMRRACLGGEIRLPISRNRATATAWRILSQASFTYLPLSFHEIATTLAVLRSLLILSDVLVPLKRVALQKQKRREGGREVTPETETETAAAAAAK